MTASCAYTILPLYNGNHFLVAAHIQHNEIQSPSTFVRMHAHSCSYLISQSCYSSVVQPSLQCKNHADTGQAHHIKHQNKQRCDLRDFVHCMNAGARRGGLSNSETAEFYIFTLESL